MLQYNFFLFKNLTTFYRSIYSHRGCCVKVYIPLVLPSTSCLINIGRETSVLSASSYKTIYISLKQRDDSNSSDYDI
jgi:hypothetical protein